MSRFDEKRRDRWTETVNTMNFTHSSRLAWNTLNNLTGRNKRPSRPCLISANSVTSQLVKNGVCKVKDRATARLINNEMSELWKIPTPPDKGIYFTSEEFACTLRRLPSGKATGPDSVCPELILHTGDDLKTCLNKFLFSCMRQTKIPKIWRRATVIAIPKPSKPLDEPRRYRPTSLLCIPFKILERLI